MYINGYEMIKFEDFIVHKKVYLQYTLSNKGNWLQTSFHLMTRLLSLQAGSKLWTLSLSEE